MDKPVEAGEVRPDDDRVDEESLKDPNDETGTISGRSILLSSSSLQELICVSSLQDLSFFFFDELCAFNWGSNALTYLDVGRFHMVGGDYCTGRAAEGLIIVAALGLWDQNESCKLQDGAGRMIS